MPSYNNKAIAPDKIARAPRHGLLGAACAALGLYLASPAFADDANKETMDTNSRNGYSAGYAFGRHLARLQDQGVALEAVFGGILDALAGNTPRLKPADMQATLTALESGRVQPAPPRLEKQPKIRARSRGFADDFAALNAKREGVTSLPSGVQYEVLKAGTGRQPLAADAVHVSYQGSLTNGVVFDTTYEDGEDAEPTRLQLADIAVPGLKEALLLMHEGDKWRVVIPPRMGFAASGNNQLRRRDLIYEIELVSVEPATTQ